MKPHITIYLLLVLLLLLGLGAVFGGGVLIISPSGNLIGMPQSILANSPFTDFLIPGIILFCVLGLFPILLIFALIKRLPSTFAEMFNFYPDMHWAWSYCVYIAFALIIWIQIQMVFLQAVHWLHIFYMFFAIAILFVALLPSVRNSYKRND